MSSSESDVEWDEDVHEQLQDRLSALVDGLLGEKSQKKSEVNKSKTISKPSSKANKKSSTDELPLPKNVSNPKLLKKKLKKKKKVELKDADSTVKKDKEKQKGLIQKEKDNAKQVKKLPSPQPAQFDMSDGSDFDASDCDDIFDDVSDEEDLSDKSSKKITGEQRHLEELKQCLGLTEADILRLKDAKKNQSIITPKNKDLNTPSGQAQRKRPPPEIVVYDDPRHRKKNKLERNENTNKNRKRKSSSSMESEDEDFFDLKQARHDVQRFGIKGLDEVSKEQAKLNMLMKLGAKPPKNTYKNYKDLQEDRKRAKEVLKGQKEDRELGYNVSAANAKKKRKRDINDVGHLDGQVGQYKRGMQVVSGQLIEATKASVKQGWRSGKKQKQGR